MDGSQYETYPGLGDEEYPGFPADECPEELPDLSKHYSLLTDVLKQESDLYDALRHTKTPLGVSLAKCLKTGIDNRGHPMVKTVGLIAGDEHCYDSFSRLFHPVIERRFGEGCLAGSHAKPISLSGLTATRADPSATYVLSTQVRSARCLQGFRFPPAVSKDERQEVERLLVSALQKLEGEAGGEYLPLRGSQSFTGKPGGMTEEQETELRAARLLFEWPDAPTALSSGLGRHWPDARGLFVNSSRNFTVWVNEDEHLRAIGIRSGDAAQEAFTHMATALNLVEEHLKGAGHAGYAFSERLGYLNACPSNIGIALRVSMIVKLPLVTAKDRWMDWSAHRGLSVRSAVDETGAPLEGLLEVSNSERLGLTEVECVNRIVEAVADLVKAEQRLERGDEGLVSLDKIERLLASTPEDPTDEGASGKDAWEAAGVAFGQVFQNAVVETKGEEESALAESERSCPKDMIRDRLASAVEDGSLEEALQSLHEERQGEFQSFKSNVKDLLMCAAEDGSLESALRDLFSEAPPAHKEEESLEGDANIASSLFGLFASAVDSGALENVLGDIAKERTAEVAESKEGEGADEPDLASSLFGIFASAADSGALENVLGELEKQRTEEMAEAKEGADDPDLASSLFGLFATAADSGALENVLGELESQRTQEMQGEEQPEEGDPDLASSLFGLFSTAVDSGALENVLDELDKERTETAATKALAGSVFDLLSGAAASGALEDVLQKALQEPEEGQVEPEELRLRIKDLLISSANSGDLEVALQTVTVAAPNDAAAAGEGEEEASVSGTDELRNRVRDCLLEAVDSGCLQEALLHSRDAQPGDDAVADEFKKHARDVLVAAADSGALLQALLDSEEDAEQPAAAADEDLSQTLRLLLMGAADSGKLEVALEETRVEMSEKAAIDAVKNKMRDVLSDALADGRLSDALQQKSDAVHDLRAEVGDLLTAAAVSGALENVLKNMQVEKETEATELDESNFKMKMLHTLAAASQDGSLEAALAVDSSTEEVSEAELKGTVRGLLEAAADSGALEQVLAELKASKEEEQQQPPQEEQQQHQLPVGNLKSQLRDVLLEAAENGSLRSALQEVGQKGTEPPAEDAPPPTGVSSMSIKELTSRTQALLYNAAETGELEAALKVIKRDSSASPKVKRDASASPKVSSQSNHSEAAKAEARNALESALTEDGEPKAEEHTEHMANICEAARGALEAALDKEEAVAAEEDDTQRMRAAAQEALEAALHGPEAAADDLDGVRQAARDALEAALGHADDEETSGNDHIREAACRALEAALEEPHNEAEPQKSAEERSIQEVTPVPPAPILVPTIPPVPKLDVSKVGQVPAVLLEAVSTADRRIGALMAMIKETEQQIIERDESCIALEANIANVRRDSDALDDALKRHREIMDEQEERHTRLQAAKAQLCNSLDEETLKQRHASLDLDMLGYTNRSEASTACTLGDLTTTPRGTAGSITTAATSWSPATERPQTAISGC